MKKSLFLLLLFTGIVKAQIVNIPDANFKNRLVNTLCVDTNNDFSGDVDVDTNNDGEIQIIEALAVNKLHVSGLINNFLLPISAQIVSMEGIQSFTSLQLLDCSSNQISVLNISNLTNLIHLNCSENMISILDVSTLININNLICYENNISILSIDNLINLQNLRCTRNNITVLNFLNLVNIIAVECNNNPISNLNFSNSNLLYSLTCGTGFNIPTLNSMSFSSLNTLNRLSIYNSNINAFDLSMFPSLTNFICIATPISSINFSNNSLLQVLSLDCSLLTNIDFTPLINLQFLDLQNIDNLTTDLSSLTLLEQLSINSETTNFTNLNLNNSINLKRLYIDRTSISSIEIENCNLLEEIDLNLIEFITSLNFSSFSNLKALSITNMSLSFLIIKNGGSGFNYLSFMDSNIDFICANEVDIPYISNNISNSTVVNSYCSFTLGGNYNSIKGNIKLDANNNGCDVSDLPQPNIRVNINDGTNTGASFSNNTGNYTFYTEAGSFVITPEIENPTWFNFTPSTATIPFAANNNNTATQDICITANGVHPDLEVILAPISPARPGFDATYELVYKNKGNQTLSGNVNLVFDDAKTDFISAISAVDNLAVNSLTWNFTTLMPFESRSIAVTLNVNSPVETPAVNIGDVLNFTTSITPIVGDELPADNTFVYNQTVVGSFDPNDITCLEGNSVAPSEIGEYLHYVINFENTGNFPAENVVVKTIVDPAKFDINSLQLLNTSAPVDARITGNVVEFIFKNVQLAGPGGHGHVLLKIKSKSTLVTGDNVAKSAGIYFDYNAPVDTGMATTVFQSLSNAVFEKDDSVSISPNPATSIININSDFNIKMIEMFDVQGRIIETLIGETKTLDISEKANGIYFLKITTEKGSKIEKVVKK